MSKIELKSVKKTYFSSAGPVSVLEDVNLTVEQGETVAIMGPSGSGKTTLLHIIGTLLKPTSGEVILDGERINTCSDEEIALIRNRKIGFVFQFHHLLPEFTSLENVMMPLLIRGEKGAREKAGRILDLVGLSHRKLAKPGELSGGERQRVALARALVGGPSLLLADEPTGNLDWKSSEELIDVIINLQRQLGFTTILVTHNEKIARLWSKIYLLERGRLNVAQIE